MVTEVVAGWRTRREGDAVRYTPALPWNVVRVDWEALEEMEAETEVAECMCLWQQL